MPEAAYRTRIHIADVHDGQIQKCFRCDRVLTDGRNTMEVIGGVGFLPWPTFSFIGITERADGLLRCIYGDGLSVAVAIRRMVLEDEIPLTAEEIALAGGHER